MKERFNSRKLLIVCIIVLGIFTIGLVIFSFVVRLEQPLFLKSYLEYNNYISDSLEQQEFTLQYLSNTDDTREVIGIEFPDTADHLRYNIFASEYPNVYMFPNNVQPSSPENLGIYSLHTVYVTVERLAGIEEESEEDEACTILKNARVQFSDGTSQEVMIGEVRINWNHQDDSKLKQISWSFSSDGNSIQTFQSSDDYTVVDLRWYPNIKSEDSFIITLNGVDASSDEIKGMKIPTDGNLDLIAEFTPPSDLNERFTSYAICPILTVQYSDGEKSEIKLNPIQYTSTPYSTWDILRYVLAQRGV